jgi:hypothetical protein
MLFNSGLTSRSFLRGRVCLLNLHVHASFTHSSLDAKIATTFAHYLLVSYNCEPTVLARASGVSEGHPQQEHEMRRGLCRTPAGPWMERTTYRSKSKAASSRPVTKAHR